MLQIVVPWPWIASLTLASAALAQRAMREGDSIAAYDERSTLVVRVVDEDGPVVRREVEVSVRRSWRKEVEGVSDHFPSLGTRSQRWSRFTDDAGVLRVPLDDPDQIKNPTTPIRVSDFAPMVLDEVELAVRSAHSAGERTLWGPFPAGELELEELTLRPLAVVAAGRVIDEQRRPVRGARIIARNVETSLPLRATADASGEFALYDVVPAAGNLQLFASTDEGLSELCTITGGEEDVVLVVSRPFGEVAGRVLLGPRVPRERVRVALQDTWWSYHLAPEDDIDFERVLDEHGAFALPRVLPATYVMKVRADRMEIASLALGTVRPGATQEPDPIDLRDELRAIRLTLVSSDAAAPFAGTVAVLDRKGFGASEPMPFDGSSCVLLSTGDPLAVELCVQGYRTVRLADLRQDWTVELEPGWPVRFVVHDELEVSGPDVSWAIALRPVGEHLFGEPIEFPHGAREVRTVVPDTGEYAVGWVRRERAGRSVYESYYPEPDYPRIEVRDVAGEQEFVFYAPVSR